MSFAQTVINNVLDRKLAEPHRPTLMSHPEARSLTKGIIAGLVAGLAATAAKTLVEKVYPPRTHGEPEPAEILAERVNGHELAPAKKQAAGENLRWAFGATTGAAYGALAEFYPAASSRDGINFGMTLMALTHESAIPAMGLGATLPDQTTREKTSEFASHIVFGLVAETTRRLVRKML
jgi:putative membrane protein